ncbi:MAG TPA: M23 family metallopeptidase [Rhizomicrobium sp.]|nr:M23 family metallopeptidase [Rhizomicrobium sp.]
MVEPLIERAWAWLHATFPERQIYIRSDGRVQFFTFGSTLQATCAGLSLIFLGWVAFASVNVIFKDRIITSKDHRFQQMQANYENRVADLQLSYDELNNALVSAEDRFKSTADQLEAKQQTVANLLGRKQVIEATVAGLGSGKAAAAAIKSLDVASAPSSSARQDVASDSLEADPALGRPSAPPRSTIGPAAPQASGAYFGSGASQLNVMPQSVEPQPRTARPTRASFLDDTVLRFAEVLFHSSQARANAPLPKTPALQALAQQTDRVRQLDSTETSLLVGVDQRISGRIGDVQRVLGRVGVNADDLERQASEAGVGGPLVSAQSARLDGVSDTVFTAAYEGAVAHTEELNTLFTALRHVPLTTPVHGPQFEMTSGFGARVDPFTRRIALHTGMDFAGPWGSTVTATAPGVVTFAGARGGYVNMVEIDHGFGFHTRYGHLAAVLVRPGTRVSEGSPVGKLGSTGRSTGPHVHYEVWVADAVKDPGKFIEAGRHVFE